MRYFFIGRRRLPGGVPRYGRTSAPLPTVSDFDSDFFSGFVSDFVPGLVSDLVSDFASGLASPLSLPPEAVVLLASGFSAGFGPLFLKSVAYQPLPFNRNPAALSIFENVSLPHSGQSVRTRSRSFLR